MIIPKLIRMCLIIQDEYNNKLFIKLGQWVLCPSKPTVAFWMLAKGDEKPEASFWPCLCGWD